MLVKMASKKRQSSLTTLLCLALGVILNDYQVKLLSQSSWGGQAPLSEKLGGPWPPWPPPFLLHCPWLEAISSTLGGRAPAPGLAGKKIIIYIHILCDRDDHDTRAHRNIIMTSGSTCAARAAACLSNRPPDTVQIPA